MVWIRRLGLPVSNATLMRLGPETLGIFPGIVT